MAEKRAWKLPVGSVRRWEGGIGKVIKSHDNGPFDDIISPWMTYPTIPKYLEDKFDDCDTVAKKIFAFKEPVEGELWLDKEFEKFETSTGKIFTGAQFKAYSPYVKGTYGFDFFAELSKRYLADKLKLNETKAEALVNANERKRTDMQRAGETANPRVLTKDEIKKVLQEVKDNFKYSGEKLEIEDVNEIHNQLKEILNYLEQGENFEGNEKEVYDKAKAFLTNLRTGPYRDINTVKSEVREMLQLMNTTFQKNWGIRESYRKKISNAFDNYISKYITQIEATELERFEKIVGVDLFVPTNEFYTALRKSSLFQKIDVTDKKWIDTFIQSPRSKSKYDDYILKNVESKGVYNDKNYYHITYLDPLHNTTSTTDVDETELQECIQAKQTGHSSLDVPMKIRFAGLYDKQLSGEWNEPDLTILETLEKLTKYLPTGHVLTNNSLIDFRKGDNLNGDNSYAHYSSNNRQIFLSSQCLSKQQLGITDLNSGHEIASVLIHEIGHSVSQKLNRRSSLLYRKFAVECGWSWEQFQWSDKERGIDKTNNYIATGNQPDIDRQGSKSDVPLITAYAGKSPEEAFAEYYSFYTQYKSEIDHYLQHRDEGVLAKEKGYVKKETDKKFSDFIHTYRQEEKLETHRQIEQVLEEQNRNLSEHIKVDVVDPYYNNLTTKEENVNKNYLIGHKKPGSDNYKSPEPVFTVFDMFTGQHDVIYSQETEDAPIHFSNKYLRRASPVFSISKDCYNLLTNKGFTINQIRDYTLFKVGDNKVPVVKKNKSNVEQHYTGLRYRSNIIPVSQLSKMSGIFSQMKKIWESDELKKALEELGFVSTTDISTLEKSEEITTKISDFFKPFTDKIKSILETGKKRIKAKTEYADAVIRNQKGQVLLLQRSYQNDFEPGKWCLPGGHVDLGESFDIAAHRELLEECNLDVELSFIEKKEKTDCIIGYYEGVVNDSSGLPIILDNNEHFRYKFVDWDELQDYELMLDLGTTLPQLPLKLIVVEEIFNDVDLLITKKKWVEEQFNNDLINIEDYLREIQDIKKSTFKFIQESFDNDLINESDYRKAYLLYHK